MAGPWERYGGGAPAQGGPIYSGVDPEEARRQEDQAFQREAAERAKRDEQLRVQAANRAGRADARAEEAANKGNEGEQKSASFYGRAIGAFNTYDQLDIGPRSYVGEVANSIAPGLVNILPEGVGNSDDRQVADQVQKEFVSAVLRKDSGAALTPDEWNYYGEMYFPRAGDRDDVLEEKRRARVRALQGLYDTAGPMAESLAPLPDLEKQKDTAPTSGSFADQYTDPTTGETVYVQQDGSKVTKDKDGNWVEVIDFGNKDWGPEGDPNLTDLAMQGFTFGLSDEASGIGRGIASVLTGERSFSEGYDLGKAEELERVRAARDKFGALGTGVEVIGGLASGGGGVIKTGIPSLRGAMREGAGVGALAGFGYGEGAQDSATNALLGAGAGATFGAAGHGIGRGVNALMQRRADKMAARAAEGAEGRAVIDAGRAEGIPIRQPDVRAEVRADFGKAEASQGGNPIVTRTLREDLRTVDNRLTQIGRGKPYDEPVDAGEVIQGALKRDKSRMRSEANRRYQAVESAAPNFQAPAPKSLAAIDDKIAELRSNGETANAAPIKVLEGIKSDLQSGGISVKALQTQRKMMRNRIKETGVDMSADDATFADVLDVMADELSDALPDAAAARLRVADKAYQEDKAFRKEIAQAFVGTRNNPMTPERAYRAFESLFSSKGTSSDRAIRLLQRMDEAERSDLAATVVSGFGRTNKGELSLPILASNLEKATSQNARALRALVGDEGFRSLKNLKVIAQAKADSGSKFNRSNTAIVAERSNGLQDLIMSGMGFSLGNLPGAAAGVAGRRVVSGFSERRAARLLLSEDFTKWLRRTPNTTNPQAIQKHFDRLSGLFPRGSALSGDAQALQQHLLNAFGQGQKLAAEPSEDTEQ